MVPAFRLIRRLVRFRHLTTTLPWTSSCFKLVATGRPFACPPITPRWQKFMVVTRQSTAISVRCRGGITNSWVTRTLLIASQPCRSEHFSFLPTIYMIGSLNSIEQLCASRKGMPRIATSLMWLTTQTFIFFTSLPRSGNVNMPQNDSCVPSAMVACKSLSSRQFLTRYGSLSNTCWDKLLGQPVSTRNCTGLPSCFPERK